MSNLASHFDIREMFPETDSHNEFAQTSYDLINRRVAIYGEIPFGRLLTEPWATLAVELERNAEEALSRGVLWRGDEVLSRLRDLRVHGSLTFACLIEMAAGPLEGEGKARVESAVATITELRRYGIHLPLPSCGCCGASSAQVSVALLLEHAPDTTYRDLFETSKQGTPLLTRFAVEYALQAGTLDVPRNGYCCANIVGSLEQECRYTGNQNDTCQVVNGQCTLGSSVCAPG